MIKVRASIEGEIDPQASMFNYFNSEIRFPIDHLIRRMQDIVDTAMQEIELCCDDM